MSDEIRMSNDELPIGWAQSKIGNLCSLKNGRAFKPTEWTTSGLPIVRIQNLNNPKSSYNHFAGEPEPRYHLLGGELLFAWSGTPGTSFGAHVWRGAEAVLNQHIFRVDFDTENMDKRFFRYAINQKLDELIDVAHGGVGLRHVTKGTFEGTEIKVPPLAEQKRIADKLEAVLGRVDACRARLDRVPALLKRFRQSVLAAATNGSLTEEWRVGANAAKAGAAHREIVELIKRRQKDSGSMKKFKEPLIANTSQWTTEVPVSWSVESVSAFAECLDSARVPVKRDKRANAKGLYPYYGANGEVDRVDDFLFDDELVLVTEDETFYGREKPIAYRSSGKCWVNNHAHVLKATDVVSSNYLCYALMYYEIIPWLTGTTGRAKLTQGVLNALPIAVPPKAEMNEIVRRVEDLFAFADRIEARLATAQKTVERLTPATLAKAFRGELVPQDPNDEPASVLLERMWKERDFDAKLGRKVLPVRIKH